MQIKMHSEAFKCVLEMYYSDLSFYATSQSVSQSEIDCRNREMLSNEQIKGKAFENIDFLCDAIALILKIERCSKYKKINLTF